MKSQVLLKSLIGLFLLGSTHFGHAEIQAHQPSQRRLDCNIIASRTTAFAKNENMPPKVLAKFETSPNIDTKNVTMDPQDWGSTTVVLDKKEERKLQQKLSYPIQVRTRILPDTTSGKQNLVLEVSLHRFNKLIQPHQFVPIATAQGPLGTKVEVKIKDTLPNVSSVIAECS